jgi:hypothetical protein
MATCRVPRKKKSLHCCMLAMMPVPAKFLATDLESPS